MTTSGSASLDAERWGVWGIPNEESRECVARWMNLHFDPSNSYRPYDHSETQAREWASRLTESSGDLWIFEARKR